MTTAEMLTAVASEGGFDQTIVPSTMILSWLNDRYAVMVARSKWLKERVELGPTVNGQESYTLPDTVVDVEAVSVGGTRYPRTSLQSLWDLVNTDLVLDGSGGVFAPEFTSAGVKQIAIYPVPTEDGDPIQALCSSLPASLDTTSSNPAIPIDYHQAIVNGAIAIGLQRIDERPDEAAYFSQEYEAATAALTARVKSRLGTGAFAIPVVGIHVT